jgi:hypothetical protein
MMSSENRFALFGIMLYAMEPKGTGWRITGWRGFAR